jgi:hypothetical protein
LANDLPELFSVAASAPERETVVTTWQSIPAVGDR